MPGPVTHTLPPARRAPVRSQSLQNVLPSGHAALQQRHTPPNRRQSVNPMAHSTSEPQLNQYQPVPQSAQQQYQQYPQQQYPQQQYPQQPQQYQVPVNGHQQVPAPQFQHHQIPNDTIPGAPQSQIPVPQTINNQAVGIRRAPYDRTAPPPHETVPEQDELSELRPRDSYRTAPVGDVGAAQQYGEYSNVDGGISRRQR